MPRADYLSIRHHTPPPRTVGRMPPTADDADGARVLIEERAAHVYGAVAAVLAACGDGGP